MVLEAAAGFVSNSNELRYDSLLAGALPTLSLPPLSSRHSLLEASIYQFIKWWDIFCAKSFGLVGHTSTMRKIMYLINAGSCLSVDRRLLSKWKVTKCHQQHFFIIIDIDIDDDIKNTAYYRKNFSFMEKECKNTSIHADAVSLYILPLPDDHTHDIRNRTIGFLAIILLLFLMMIRLRAQFISLFYFFWHKHAATGRYFMILTLLYCLFLVLWCSYITLFTTPRRVFQRPSATFLRTIFAPATKCCNANGRQAPLYVLYHFISNDRFWCGCMMEAGHSFLRYHKKSPLCFDGNFSFRRRRGIPAISLYKMLILSTMIFRFDGFNEGR